MISEKYELGGGGMVYGWSLAASSGGQSFKNLTAEKGALMPERPLKMTYRRLLWTDRRMGVIKI